MLYNWYAFNIVNGYEPGRMTIPKIFMATLVELGPDNYFKLSSVGRIICLSIISHALSNVYK